MDNINDMSDGLWSFKPSKSSCRDITYPCRHYVPSETRRIAKSMIQGHCRSSAKDLLQRVLYRPNHAIQYLFEDREPTKYSLRFRTHAKELIQKTPNFNNSHFSDKTVIQRLLLVTLIYNNFYV